MFPIFILFYQELSLKLFPIDSEYVFVYIVIVSSARARA